MYLANFSHQIIYLKLQQQPFSFFFGKIKNSCIYVSLFVRDECERLVNNQVSKMNQ